jgi:hypothetical protein
MYGRLLSVDYVGHALYMYVQVVVRLDSAESDLHQRITNHETVLHAACCILSEAIQIQRTF